MNRRSIIKHESVNESAKMKSSGISQKSVECNTLEVEVLVEVMNHIM